MWFSKCHEPNITSWNTKNCRIQCTRTRRQGRRGKYTYPFHFVEVIVQFCTFCTTYLFTHILKINKSEKRQLKLNMNEQPGHMCPCPVHSMPLVYFTSRTNLNITIYSATNKFTMNKLSIQLWLFNVWTHHENQRHRILRSRSRLYLFFLKFHPQFGQSRSRSGH